MTAVTAGGPGLAAEALEAERDGEVGDVIGGLVPLQHVAAGELGDHAVDRLGEHLGIAVADGSFDDAVLEVAPKALFHKVC